MPYNKYSQNLAIIVGRVGKKPEIRYSNSGTAVANLSVATTTSHKNEDQTEWHRVVVFGKTAEFIEQYIDKGDLVSVSGRLQTSNWEDKNGNKHYKTEIIANDFTSLGSNSPSSGTSDRTSDPTSAPEPQDDLDDLPF